MNLTDQVAPVEDGIESVDRLHLHEATTHASLQRHHHHTHAEGSHHEEGHHLLQVEGLSVGFLMYDSSAPFFKARKALKNVIEDLSIAVHSGEIVAIVGASGSGKTLLADSLTGLFEPNALVSGTIWLDGERMDAASLACARGSRICFVPQSVSFLDPLMKVGRQVEGFCSRGGSKQNRIAKRKALFARYGLSEDVANLYPFELSGGMARRILLCCALIDDPQVIIADEPTPGLDPALVETALADLRCYADQTGGGVMLITHDIEMALRIADRVAVFKDGTIIEEASAASFRSEEGPDHPFSRALIAALPENGFAGCFDCSDCFLGKGVQCSN